MANKPKVVEIKTADLSGDALSYAVALATGTVDKKFRVTEDGSVKSVVSFEPWNNWYHGGPLFEQYGPTFAKRGSSEYFAVLPASALLTGAWGPTHLIALCRAVALEELGDVVEVPAALIASHAEELAKAKNDDQGHLPLNQPAAAPAAKPAETPAKPAAEAQGAQKQPQSAPESKAAASPGGKPGVDKAPAKDPAKPEDKPASKPQQKTHEKPAPQGKFAQAMKDHGQPPAGKGKGK